MEGKLVAVLHDNTIEGDSEFYAPSLMSALRVKPDAALNEIIHLEIERETSGDDYDDDDRKEYSELMYNAKGAWLISEDTLRLIDEIWNELPIGSDGATYRTNAICKIIARHFALINVTR